ncbi:hypothetical protein FFRU_380050, partial [Fructobacillus fructosus]
GILENGRKGGNHVNRCFNTSSFIRFGLNLV